MNAQSQVAKAPVAPKPLAADTRYGGLNFFGVRSTPNGSGAFDAHRLAPEGLLATPKSPASFVSSATAEKSEGKGGSGKEKPEVKSEPGAKAGEPVSGMPSLSPFLANASKVGERVMF